MTEPRSQGGALIGTPGPASVGVLDPELLALPAPPRAGRRLSLALLASAMLGAASLLLHLRADVGYALSADRAVELGDATSAAPSELPLNRYVRIGGSPMLSRGVRYERTFSGRTYAVFPLAGQRQIYVQVELGALQDPARIAQGTFTGRLLTFGQLGSRLRPLRAFLARQHGLPVTAESFVILAGEPPSAYRFALLISAGCAAMLLLGLGLFWRWFRPLK